MAPSINVKMLTSEAVLVESWSLMVPESNDANAQQSAAKEARASSAAEIIEKYSMAGKLLFVVVWAHHTLCYLETIL